ncbi:MAG TPA: hypothetical protein VF753_14465 [Terriglobales bacterium]
MRTLSTVCLVLLFSCFAAAQATIVGGYASNWAPSYGVYLAAPFVPLISTPSISLSYVSPSPVGASNTAFGLSAGATNSTLSIATEVPVSGYTQPVWYNSAGPMMNSASSESSALPRREGTGGGTVVEAAFDFGVSSEAAGIASRTPRAGSGGKAARSYTNQDTDRMNDTNGTVKFRGQTEKL